MPFFKTVDRREDRRYSSKEDGGGDDSALAVQAGEGDEAAFELLVRRHAPAAWRLARSMLSDDFQAEEAVQDAFVKAYGALPSFRGDSAFRTWLLKICHRTCLDRIRSRRVEPVPLSAVADLPVLDESPDLAVLLEQTLERLSADERQAFELVHVVEFSREEAAEICGVPASTMRARVTRARQRLAAAMTEAEVTENHG